MKEFVTVGRVKDAHGLKGELYITLFAQEAVWLKKLKNIRLLPPALEGKEALAADGSTDLSKTFAVRSARLHKNGLILLSPDIQGRNAAEALRGWLLAIPSEFLVARKGEEPFLIEVEGFRVSLKDRGEVGIITGFSSNGVQDLLVVRTPVGEFEVPFVDAFVTNIDYTARVVEMDLPVGLLGEEAESETPGEPG